MNHKLDFSRISGFEWDEGNINKNWTKHKVSIYEAEEVFNNHPQVIVHDEKHSQKEERFTILGQADSGRLLTIIFTIRGNKVRVISVRDQNRVERKVYAKEN